MKTTSALLLALGLTVTAPNALRAEDKPAPAATEAVAKDLSAKEIAALLEAAKKDAKPTVLDVRTPDEYSGAHIAGAKNIDFMDDSFEAEVKKLDKKAPYVVHCAAGGRSAKAMAKLKALGFTNLLHMKDGFKAWQANGSPTVAGEEKK